MRAVSLGGGHGQAAVLRALRYVDADVTAIVSVADDGGSSGRLVREFGIPPPGDARRNLIALSGDTMLAGLFAFRFGAGDLEGHSLGNLVIAALVERVGDFEGALCAAADLLGATGVVLPAAVEPVRLIADVEGALVEGQDTIKRQTNIGGIEIDPPDPAVSPVAVDAIAAADLIVIGPGSLFTSVLPVLCIPKLRDAIAASSASRVYVSNLTVQAGETEGMDTGAHVAALIDNVGKSLFDHVLVNDGPVAYGDPLDIPDAGEVCSIPVVKRYVAADRGSVHDRVRLGEALQDLAGCN